MFKLSHSTLCDSISHCWVIFKICMLWIRQAVPTNFRTKFYSSWSFLVVLKDNWKFLPDCKLFPSRNATAFKASKNCENSKSNQPIIDETSSGWILNPQESLSLPFQGSGLSCPLISPDSNSAPLGLDLISAIRRSQVERSSTW